MEIPRPGRQGMPGERRVEGSQCPDRLGSGGQRGASVPGGWRWLLCGARRGAGRPLAWRKPPWGRAEGLPSSSIGEILGAVIAAVRQQRRNSTQDLRVIFSFRR
ncbi:hypothetical protein BS78_04G127400 [Paspalum vaginatum]|nr:hypothetical protein BS78_04G127400 [Paspalum vaginatum]